MYRVQKREEEKSPSITFDVSPVQPASQPLREISYKQAVENLVNPFHAGLFVEEESIRTMERYLERETPGHREMEQKELEERKNRLEQAKLSPYPPSYHPVEACASYHDPLVDGVRLHPLMAALHFAYLDHRPVCLSPDIIWLVLCQGVVNHIRANAESMRVRFQHQSGKPCFEVQRDDFIKGSPENPWPEVFHELSQAVQQHFGPARDLFAAEFSTTGPVERAAQDILLLDAMQSFCSYSLGGICGIPRITLEGTAADWQVLLDRVQKFQAFDLEWWVTLLLPILEQFVAAAQGQVDPSFWRSIFKYGDDCVPVDVNGWVTILFPYLRDQSGFATRRNEVLSEAFDLIRLALPNKGATTASGISISDWRTFYNSLEGDNWLQTILFPNGKEGGCGPNPLKSFPAGLSKAPFVWKYRNTKFAMEFLGGFAGVRQDPVTLSLRPEIGWAVREGRV